MIHLRKRKRYSTLFIWYVYNNTAPNLQQCINKTIMSMSSHLYMSLETKSLIPTIMCSQYENEIPCHKLQQWLAGIKLLYITRSFTSVWLTTKWRASLIRNGRVVNIQCTCDKGKCYWILLQLFVYKALLDSRSHYVEWLGSYIYT